MQRVVAIFTKEHRNAPGEPHRTEDPADRVGGPVGNQHRAWHREGQGDDQVEPEGNAVGGLEVVEHAEQRPKRSRRHRQAQHRPATPWRGAWPPRPHRLPHSGTPARALLALARCSKGIIDANRPEIVTNKRTLDSAGGEQAANTLQPADSSRHATPLDAKVTDTITASPLVRRRPCLSSHGSAHGELHRGRGGLTRIHGPCAARPGRSPGRLRHPPGRAGPR